MNIVQKILSDGEYNKKVVEKNTIYIHHTAGSSRPDWTIDGWERDRTKTGARLPVGTAYVIGGIDRATGNADYDGVIYQAFDEKYWAYHLGLSVNNDLLNSQAVAIEICNYGYVIKAADGTFLNYVNSPIPANMVIDLGANFRGFRYWHAYTKNQLASLKWLIQDICTRHPKIDSKAGLVQFLNSGLNAFEINQAALKGVPGIWSHTSVRKDKFDMYPHPQLIELIKTL